MNGPFAPSLSVEIRKRMGLMLLPVLSVSFWKELAWLARKFHEHTRTRLKKLSGHFYRAFSNIAMVERCFSGKMGASPPYPRFVSTRWGSALWDPIPEQVRLLSW